MRLLKADSAVNISAQDGDAKFAPGLTLLSFFASLAGLGEVIFR
jgi:hypothetical protein